MAQTTKEIRCPKCDSNQLTVNQKTKVGGLLSNNDSLNEGVKGITKIVFTCTECRWEFQSAEDKNGINPNHSDNDSSLLTSETNSYDEVDNRIINLIKSQGKIAAIKYCKESKNVGLKEAKEYVEHLALENGISSKRTPSEGCFIATACYGDYDAPEVLVLRKYRDKVLKSSLIGKIFIKTYYTISPPFAKVLSKSDSLRNVIRKNLLQPLIQRLGNKSKH